MLIQSQGPYSMQRNISGKEYEEYDELKIWYVRICVWYTEVG